MMKGRKKKPDAKTIEKLSRIFKDDIKDLEAKIKSGDDTPFESREDALAHDKPDERVDKIIEEVDNKFDDEDFKKQQRKQKAKEYNERYKEKHKDDPPIKCEFCNRSYKKTLYKRHCNSKKHHENEAKAKQSE